MKDGVKEILADSARVKYWLSVGAQPSDRVEWLFSKVGLLPPPPPRISPSFTFPKWMTRKAKT